MPPHLAHCLVAVDSFGSGSQRLSGLAMVAIDKFGNFERIGDVEVGRVGLAVEDHLDILPFGSGLLDRAAAVVAVAGDSLADYDCLAEFATGSIVATAAGGAAVARATGLTWGLQGS